ncbi:hypothetical protein [Rhodopseudomonas telluris]|uniref:Uncharacterized protein n=1 Tax=Rhodopseudomonas telluris TaxID=644215 RepID=A0ABV6EXJ8_9BRAD
MWTEAIVYLLVGLAWVVFSVTLLAFGSFFFFSFRSAKKQEMRRRLRRLAPEMHRARPELVAVRSFDNIVAELGKTGGGEAEADLKYLAHQYSKVLASRLVVDAEFKSLLRNHVALKKKEGVLPQTPALLMQLLLLIRGQFERQNAADVLGFARSRMVQGSDLWFWDRSYESWVAEEVLRRHADDLFRDLAISLVSLSASAEDVRDAPVIPSNSSLPDLLD